MNVSRGEAQEKVELILNFMKQAELLRCPSIPSGSSDGLSISEAGRNRFATHGFRLAGHDSSTLA